MNHHDPQRYSPGVYYMVKRLDTGEVYGHNTFHYTPQPNAPIAEVREMERNGVVHHLEVFLNAATYAEAQQIASFCFDDHEQRNGDDDARR